MTSVADILRKNGEWMRGEALRKAVEKGLSISTRQTYRKIRYSVDKKQVIRITQPNRTTLYGLPGWPPSKLPENAPARKLQSRHIRNIALGLRSLIQVGKYRVEGELIPREDYRKFAFQHYPEIADTYDEINYKKGLGLRILTIYDEFANKTLEELEGHGIKVDLNNAKDIIDCILKPFDLSNVYSKIDRKIQIKSSESGRAAYCGGRLLFPVKDDKDAEILKRDLKLSISKTMQGNEVLLQELKVSLEQRSNLSNGFREKVKFLINKLLDMGKLDGECDICKNAK